MTESKIKSEYQRENLKITQFDTEDVITTSGMLPTEPSYNPIDPSLNYERENRYRSFNRFGGSWF